MIVERQRGRLAGTVGLALHAGPAATLDGMVEAVSRAPGISWVMPAGIAEGMEGAVLEAAGELPVIVEREAVSLWSAAWATWPVAVIGLEWVRRRPGELATAMAEAGPLTTPAEALVLLESDEEAAASITPVWLDGMSAMLSWTAPTLGSLCWSGSQAMRQRLAQAIAASRTPWRLDR